MGLNQGREPNQREESDASIPSWKQGGPPNPPVTGPHLQCSFPLWASRSPLKTMTSSLFYCCLCKGLQVALTVKNLPANTGDVRDRGSIPGWGRSPGGGHGNPLQCSCLENPMERGWALWGPGGLQSMGSQRIGNN